MLQRLFYAAREKAPIGTRFSAAMNAGTLREVGREVAMGGVDAATGLSAACEEAAQQDDGPTGIILWNVELTLERQLGDSEIRVDEVSVN